MQSDITGKFYSVYQEIFKENNNEHEREQIMYLLLLFYTNIKSEIIFHEILESSSNEILLKKIIENFDHESSD